MDSQQYNDMMMNKPEYITRIGACLRLLQDEANNIKQVLNEKITELDSLTSIVNNYCAIEITVNNIDFYCKTKKFNSSDAYKESMSTSSDKRLTKPITKPITFNNKMFLTYYSPINSNNVRGFVGNNFKTLFNHTSFNEASIKENLGINNFDNVELILYHESDLAKETGSDYGDISTSISFTPDPYQLLNDTSAIKIQITIPSMQIYYSVKENNIIN